jgi:hypothetical protein
LGMVRVGSGSGWGALVSGGSGGGDVEFGTGGVGRMVGGRFVM